MENVTNTQKYENYKAQMGQLTHAINAHFYLEALFIEYGVMEDRTEAILLCAGKKVNPKAGLKQKIEAIRKLVNHGGMICKYISPQLLDDILAWADVRNDFIHRLMKQVFTGEELKVTVDQGREIVKTLNNKSSCYKRAIARQNKEGK